MTNVLHRAVNKTYPVAAKSAGIRITDETGKDYIDASGGAAVVLPRPWPSRRAGRHAQAARHPRLRATSFSTTRVAEELADHLVAHAPRGISNVYFCGSGSEAIEACLKMARHYFVEKGELQRTKFISRRQSYHGITLGALSVGGRMKDRAPFSEILFDAHHVSPCFEYRGRRADETPEAYGARLAAELEAKIVELGPRNVAAFVAETVVGATLGAATAVPGYFKRVREVCDRHGVLLILDEVMSGMGRTGTLHACEQEGIAPDLMAIAKGLGGGFAPIGAMLVSKHVFDAIGVGSGAFPHSQTYVGHPLACAAGLAVQTVIQRDNLLANVSKQGDYLERRLRESFANHHHVGDIRGRGLFRGVEIVEDRASKKPFDPALKLHARIKQTAMDHGLMVYPMGGTDDGKAGDHVLLAPPFIVTERDIDDIVEILGVVIDKTIAGARR